MTLAVGLWPILRRTEGARIVSVSSRGHKRAPVEFDDPNFNTRPYDPWVAYGESKSANACLPSAQMRSGAATGYAPWLSTRRRADGSLAIHLGGSTSRCGRIDAEGRPIIDPANDLKTAAQGAATAVWCATSRQLDGFGGVNCENCDIARAVGEDSKELLGVRAWAIDPKLAERLWNLGEALTNTRINSETAAAV